MYSDTPCGLHLLSSDAGKENGDSFGGDSLRKVKHGLINLKKDRCRCDGETHGLSSSEAKRAAKPGIKGSTLTDCWGQQGLWKQTQSLLISPGVTGCVLFL